MRFIDVEKADITLPEFVNRAPTEEDCAWLIDEDTTLVADGVPVLVYQTNAGDPAETARIGQLLQRIPYDKTVRVKKLVTQSRTIGFQPRSTIRRDFCTTAKLATEDPELHGLLCAYAAKAVGVYQASGPEILERHMAKVGEKVREEFVIPGTPFTSGIVNKNNPLMYHFDGGNDHDVWSAMFCLRDKTEGGRLALPEFGLKFAIANNSLLMFDGQKLLHGVTPILAGGKGAYRFTVVYYSRREMWNCLPLDAEVARTRRSCRASLTPVGFTPSAATAQGAVEGAGTSKLAVPLHLISDGLEGPPIGPQCRPGCVKDLPLQLRHDGGHPLRGLIPLQGGNRRGLGIGAVGIGVVVGAVMDNPDEEIGPVDGRGAVGGLDFVHGALLRASRIPLGEV